MTEAEDHVAGNHRNAFILLALGGAVLACFGIAALGSIIAPVFLAMILTICMHPLRVWLERHRVPRGIATGAVILAVVVLLVGFGYAVLVAFGQFSALLPQFADQIAGFGEEAVAWLKSVGISSRELNALIADFDPSVLVDFVGGLIGGLAGIGSALVILLTIALLLGMDAGHVATVLAQTSKTHPLVVTSMSAYAANVRRYMVATTLLGLAQGVIDFVALVLLGVPGAFIWGLLAFLCSFIPNIGYFVAIIPPIVFGALVGGWPTVIAVIVVYAVINAIVQSVIQPRVIGNAVSLSQTITFFSVLFWAVILGPIGAILAIPLTLLVRLVLVDTYPPAGWVRPLLGDLRGAGKGRAL
ncbi:MULTISPECIES: AI-2E family transporter [unclassified Microbacterium]|uniref:AI-2E family transporter n=1 Tax=unclassified Microbacterium TaxID=2609290 RepID=UPI00214B911A|nr:MULTISPECIES: AI-2E family transporter [unclassified Microbacterium]MCR2784402.1 AI-2E family transporter [Microbacterium sp. zg.B96]WIM14780.1 AI-2E family transporter [Microbacterium sp. zg-B96]